MFWIQLLSAQKSQLYASFPKFTCSSVASVKCCTLKLAMTGGYIYTPQPMANATN